MATFRSFWYKGPVSPYERMCFRSFVDFGHKFILYSYDKIDVPAGVKLSSASAIIDEKDYFCYAKGPGKGSPSAFSNLFRYELLLRHGDWWVDTDVICLSDQVPEQPMVYAYQDTREINGAILKMPAGSDLAFELAAEARTLGTGISWGDAGPRLITRTVEKKSLEKHCVDRRLLYPLSYDEPLDLLAPDLREAVERKCAGSKFLHLWNEILKRTAVRKDISPPTGSFLFEKFKKHKIKFPSGLIYSSDEVTSLRDNSFIARFRLQQQRDAALAAYEATKQELEVLRNSVQAVDKNLSKSLELRHAELLGAIEKLARDMTTTARPSNERSSMLRPLRWYRRNEQAS